MKTPTDELRHGEVIDGRFRILEPLGSGGMGCVYRAKQLDVERDVVIKVLSMDGPEERVLARFRREARLTASINHPNVVSVIAYGDGQRPYLAMEWVEGETLGQRLQRRGPLSSYEVGSLGVQILAGLAEAHAQGLVHRDLKPENLMVVRKRDGEELIKILDFGIAKPIWSEQLEIEGETFTAEGALVGTPRYMAPEQIEREAEPRSDLYAIGLILYELLTGAHPIAAESPMGFLVKHAGYRPKPLLEHKPDLNKDLAALIHQALSKKPEERHPNALAMRAALLKILPSLKASTSSEDALAWEETGTIDFAPETQEADEARQTSENDGKVESPKEAPAEDTQEAPLPSQTKSVIYLLVLVIIGGGGLLFSLFWVLTHDPPPEEDEPVQAGAPIKTEETPQKEAPQIDVAPMADVGFDHGVAPIEPGPSIRGAGKEWPVKSFPVLEFLPAIVSTASKWRADAGLISIEMSGHWVDGKMDLSQPEAKIILLFRSPSEGEIPITPNRRPRCVTRLEVYESGIFQSYLRTNCDEPILPLPTSIPQPPPAGGSLSYQEEGGRVGWR